MANLGTFKGSDIEVIGMTASYQAIINRVQGWGFDPSYDTDQQSHYSRRTPLEINKTYNGVSGSIDLQVTASKDDQYQSDVLICLLTNQDPDPNNAAVVGFDPADYGKLDQIANVFDGDPEKYLTETKIVQSFFVEQSEISANPLDSSLDGVTTQSFDYDAVTGIYLRGALTLAVHTAIGVINSTDDIDLDPSNPSTSAFFMDEVLNPKKRGTTGGHLNQLDALGGAGATALIATMVDKGFKGKFHIYAGFDRAGTWKKLTEASSTWDVGNTTVIFNTGEALQAADVLKILILFEDAISIV